MTERHAAYVIGSPGSGKSTLVDHLTRALAYEEAEQPFAHRVYDVGVFELGRRRHEFSGTDALPMNVQPAATQFIEGIQPKLLLAEGDRLANDKFFKAIRAAGYSLVVYYLEGDKRAQLQRDLRGSPQDESWIKGRITKVTRLAAQWDAVILQCGGRLADLEALMVDPVSSALKAGRVPVGVEA